MKFSIELGVGMILKKRKFIQISVFEGGGELTKIIENFLFLTHSLAV